MKSYESAVPHGIDCLAATFPLRTISSYSGAFQAARPSRCHWAMTPAIWVPSTVIWASMCPSLMISASVPKIGVEVITGEHIRIRSVASPKRVAMSCDMARPRPGEKTARTVRGPSVVRIRDMSSSKEPVSSGLRRRHKSSKSRV